MRVFVYVTVLYSPLTAVSLARLAPNRLHPRYAAWLLTAAAVMPGTVAAPSACPRSQPLCAFRP